MYLLSVVLFASCLGVFTAPVEESALNANAAPKNKEWWQSATFYQIYPRSFKDSDGDGLGDLKGITEKLEHVRDTGITATWLSPIFDSPMRDAGYDIADFYNIYPQFGTMDDFEILLTKAKELGLKIILDFVPNHSSNDSVWFQKSIDKIEPYTDYYVWRDAKIVNGKRQPPNNWISNFHGPAWEWNEKRQQYYYHQFGVFQPDLNYNNPKVVEEMKNVIRFWLGKGVAGFRIDAVPFLFEDPELRDEPRSHNPDCTDQDECYLTHIYTQNLNDTIDMMVQWRDVLKDVANKTDGVPRVMMTEAYAPLDTIFRYYGNKTHDGACFTFNFDFITELKNESDASQLEKLIHRWLDNMPEGRTPNWVLGNHDNHRLASRIGPQRSDGLIMISMTLPGVAVSYNGEEINQEDGFVSWKDTQDPSALNAGEDRYLLFTRDPERTPFQWDDSKNAGFSTANKTWLPVSDKYETVNVAKDRRDSNGHFDMYQRLTKLRKTQTLLSGDLEYQLLNPNVFALKRSLPGHQTLVTVVNWSHEKSVAHIPASWVNGKDVTVEIASVNSTYTIGQKLEASLIQLPAYEAYVLSN